MDSGIIQTLRKVAQRSTSRKKQVGAMLIRNSNIKGVLGQLVATGHNYNSEDPTGPCEKPLSSETYETVIHAEVACLMNYDKQIPMSQDLTNYTMYLSHTPCMGCRSVLENRNCKWKVINIMPTVKPLELKELTSVTKPAELNSTSPIDHTLKERGSAYGSFEGNAKVTQSIFNVLVSEAQRPLQMYELEALHMIAHKMSRIVNGQKMKKDNWHDIAGYAKLAEDLTTDA